MPQEVVNRSKIDPFSDIGSSGLLLCNATLNRIPANRKSLL